MFDNLCCSSMEIDWAFLPPRA